MAENEAGADRNNDNRSKVVHVGVVDYERVADDYLQKRQLKKGAAGWILLAGLGVSYVISGDFAGWNFGLEQGGFGGLLIATLLMAAMYTFMVLGIAELSSAIATAGGGYGFARRAMGPLGGFLTGTAILLEYAIAPVAIAISVRTIAATNLRTRRVLMRSPELFTLRHPQTESPKVALPGQR